MADEQAEQPHARPDAWPPHPSIECGYTDAQGRRWVHRPWAGWQPAASPRIIRTRRRARRWWPA